MKKYFVNLPGGTKDFQFQQVLDLLISEGHKTNDERDKRKVKQADGSFKEQGFLYLFDDHSKAEKFADLVREKTNNPSWSVFDVDVESIEELIEQHRELRDQPLVLAMYYDAGDDPGEIYLLEVIDNFGFNSVNPDRELFEVTFPKTDGSKGKPGQQWHLILTNPPEFDTALRENWEHAAKIRQAVNNGRYEVIYMTSKEGVHNRELING